MLYLATALLAAFDANALRASVAAGGDHWAVLVAGSNTYGNYRHQSDVCHAYQVAKAAGMPESNIIVLAYDDIAHNPENPYPGKMFNKPSMTPRLCVSPASPSPPLLTDREVPPPVPRRWGPPVWKCTPAATLTTRART